MKKTLLILFSLALLWGCMDDPFENHSLSLSGEAGVTEAWLEVHVEGLKRNADYILQRDGKTVFKGRLQTRDTVLYDSLLSPSTTYRYRIYAREGGENSPAAETGLTTMDTTSHEFDWRVYTFGGQKGSSVFYDVAIIDENDIWAVGQIFTEDTYTYDSLGNFIQPYNAAHWDGEKWTLKRIDWDGNVSKLTCVFAFSNDDVWFGVTNLIHWNGTTFEKNWNPVLDQFYDKTINKIWGTSSSDFYVVGNNGMMAHYDGTRWTKIGTGTDLNFYDIQSSVNPFDGERETLSLAGDILNTLDRKIFRIKDSKIKELRLSQTPTTLHTISFMSGRKYYVAGARLYTKINHDQKWKQVKGALNRYYIENITINDGYEVFTCGDFGEIMHYNGNTWRLITRDSGAGGNYYSIKSFDNTVVAVGSGKYAEARLIIGKR